MNFRKMYNDLLDTLIIREGHAEVMRILNHVKEREEELAGELE